MGLEQVQLRPGMYIGDTADGTGLDNMVAELVGNALAEAPVCDRIAVTLHDDQVVSVRDNGAGLPVDTESEWGVPIAELAVTQLYAETRRLARSRKSRDLPGCGPAVVNALSEDFTVRIWRGGLEYAMRFYLGAFLHRLTCTGAAGNVKGLPRRGTEIVFKPSGRFFAATAYDFARLEKRLRTFEAIKCGTTITLTDRRGGGAKSVAIEV